MRAGTSEVHTLGLGSCPAHPASQMRPAQEPCGQAVRRSPSVTPSLETGTATLALRSVCWTSDSLRSFSSRGGTKNQKPRLNYAKPEGDGPAFWLMMAPPRRSQCRGSSSERASRA